MSGKYSMVISVATAVLERNIRYLSCEICDEDRALLTQAGEALRECKKHYGIFKIPKMSDR